MKRALTSAGLLLASILITLAVLELVIRVTCPVSYRVVSVNTWDPEVGTRQVPNARGLVVCPEYDIDIEVNSKGLRDREFEYRKPDRTRRILCLGDSFMCGYGVAAEDALPKVLESRLRSGPSDTLTWEVLNAGVGSTGTAHQLAYFASEGWRYEPDVVVLGFFAGNDFSDNLYSRLYELEGGELVKHKAPRTGARRVQAITRWIPGYRTLFARSHLLSLIKIRASRLHRRRLRQDTSERNSPGELFPDMRALTERLIVRLDAECRERSCDLVVLIIPASETTEEEPDPRTEGLVRFMSERGLACLDLSQVFSSEEGRSLLRYPQDKHWNEAGHRRAAELLHEYLLLQ